MNWNLIKCAFGKHTYGDAIQDDTLKRIVKICKFCGNTIKISDTYETLREKKKLIITAVENERFEHAKRLINELLKGYGY